MATGTEGHLGRENVPVRRDSQGRRETVLSILDSGSERLAVLHIRLLPQARALRRRFREVDALRLMGFTPRPECPFFPYQCFYAGCYYRELGTVVTPDEQAAYEALFDRVLAHLEEAIEHFLQGAWVAEAMGLPLK